MQTNLQSSRLPALLERLLPWAIGGGVLACFLVLALGSYTIKAYSDCLNWLNFASNFGYEFTHSCWPWGFPLYLRGVLALVGPYWVYLANLPVMLVLFVLVSCAGLLFRRHDAMRVPASWAFLSTWIVILSTDARSFTRYLNPYRDPLSYVLLLASVVLFVRSLAAASPRRRGWGVAGSGVLLGLACSVRETSILMVGPMALYGLLTWWAGCRGKSTVAEITPGMLSDRPFSFWPTVLAFAAGMAVALVPLLVQTYLTTHQMILPPQSSIDSAVVPGAHFDSGTFRHVGVDAWRHYTRFESWLLVLAAAGLLVAAIRRDRFALALVVPTAVVYILFYSFYWTFVIRYFYVAFIFISLLGAYALTTLLAAIARIPRFGRAACWLVLAVAAWASGAKILAERAPIPVHQVPQARAMAAEWLATCPEDATVIFADRHLCEWISWFTPWHSRALPAWVGYGGSVPDAIRAELGPMLARGDFLLAACWGTPGDLGSIDATFLRRAFDRIPLATFDPSPYHADDYVQGIVTFYRIEPWSGNRTALDWTIPAAGPRGAAYWYMLDAGEWPGEAPGPATISVDGTPIPRPVPHGKTWVDGVEPADASDAPRTVSAIVEASHPLPREMNLATGRLDDPIPFDFRYRALFDHLWRWSGDVILPGTAGPFAPVVTGTAELLIPVPLPALAGAIVGWEMLTTSKAPGVRLPVSVWEGDRLLASAEIPADRFVFHLATLLPPDSGRDTRTLRLVIEPQPNPTLPGNPDIALEIYQTTLHRTPAAYPIRIDFGARGNDFHLRSGFHPPEGRGENAYRWTSGPAEVAVFLPDPKPSPGKPVTLRIFWTSESVPDNVPGMGTLRVAWDGTPLDGQVSPDPDAPGRLLWQATVPPNLLSPETSHRVTLDAPAWRPSDYGSRDPRTLAIRLFRLTLDSAP